MTFSRTLPPRLPGRSAALTVALAALWVLAAGGAGARTPLEQQWAPYRDWQLAHFRLEGVPAALEGELEGGLALAGSGRFLRGRRLPAFRTRLLLEDLARARLFLAREGFPAAVVTPVAEPDPARRRLGVTFRIEPGPAVTVRSVSWPGWPDDLPPPAAGDPRLLGPGSRFRDARFAENRLHLRRLLREEGHALAEVTAAAQPAGATAVDLVYTVTPGDRFDIVAVGVEGCSPDLEALTRSLIKIEPPVRYAPSRIEEAAFELRATQLFRQVNLETAPVGTGRLELIAAMENARMRSLETSLGTWSDNPWRLRVAWQDRNLLGGGRGLDVHAAAATHTQSAGGGLNWYGWLAPRARTRLGAEWIREDEEAYRSREWRLDLSSSLRPRGRDLVHLGVSLARVSVTPFSVVDQAVIDEEGTLLEIWADRKWDRLDDPLYPRRGGFGKLAATLSPPTGLSEAAYLALQGDLSLHRPLGRTAVLVGRLRAGWARPLGDAVALIPNRRFHAGGYATMRGAGRRKLGPRDAAGLALGGNAVLLAGAEARLPLAWILGVSLFVDAGQVWARAGDIRLAEMQTAAGVSLDARTPLGPVRFGYAWSLGPGIPGEPGSLAHFGVGFPW